MRKVIVDLYSAGELKALFPEAFEFAHIKYVDEIVDSSDLYSEVIESLKELIKYCDYNILSYSMSVEGYGDYLRIEHKDHKWEEPTTLRKSMAWLENRVLSYLRIPYTGKERKNLRKYGKFYYAGKIKPCPLTGVCYDDDLIDELIKTIRAGNCPRIAIQRVFDKACKLLQEEYKYRCSAEAFIECSECNGWEYYKSGRLSLEN